MKGHPIKYSEAEMKWVSDNRTLPSKELHTEFSKKFNRTGVSATNLGSLRKRKGWLTGRSGCFHKGHKPHNAGSAGTGLMKPNKTSFKQGARPHNWMPVGSTRVSKDGYIEVKTQEPRVWAQLHTLVWSAKHGEVPSGHCVAFKDGDKENIHPDNLELITRNENLQINRLQCSSLDLELRPVVRTLGKLIAKTSETARAN